MVRWAVCRATGSMLAGLTASHDNGVAGNWDTLVSRGLVRKTCPAAYVIICRRSLRVMTLAHNCPRS